MRRLNHVKGLLSIAAIVLLLGAAAPPAWACRYNVRDVGFVDLGTKAFVARIVAGRGADLQTIRSAAEKALADSNVVVEATAEHEGPALKLTLVAPDGRELPLPVAGDGPDALGDALAGVLRSPLRDQMRTRMLEHYGVVIVVDGGDAATNAKARESAGIAAAQITEALPSLPKPIDKGPVVMHIDAATAETERVLLFALGIAQDRRGEAADVAIVYGRMRRLGPVLPMPPNNHVELASHMSYIGADCECELDRSWMTGDMIPHAWTAADETAAANALGFDPGSPLVKSEIEGILARGPNPEVPQRRVGVAAPIDPLLGYTEVAIEPVKALPNDAPTAATPGAPGEAEAEAAGPAATAALSPVPPAATKPAQPHGASELEMGFMQTNATWIVLASIVAAVVVVGTLILSRARRES